MYEITAAFLVILFVLWYREPEKHIRRQPEKEKGLFLETEQWRKRNISIFSDLGIPGPQPSLLFGNIIELYTKGPVKCHEEWVEKYGRILGYYYGMRPILLIADPQILKSIFIKDFSKFVDRVPFQPLLDLYESEAKLQSVLNLRGQKWKEVRSVLTPSFSTAKMKKMSAVMNSSIDAMIDVMREKAKDSEEFNIHDSFQRLTMEVIAKLAFGVVTDIQTNPKHVLLHAAKVLFNTDYKDVFVFIGMCFPYLKWMMRKLQMMSAVLLNKGRNPMKMFEKGVAKVMQLRRNKPETRKPDILQLMLDTKIKLLENSEINVKNLEVGHENEADDAGNKEEPSTVTVRNMTDDEVIASSVVVFLAGYETTSTALAFTSHLLAKHPEVQDRIFEEVCGLIKGGEKLDYGSVNKLPYLDQVLSESMRIYPPVYLFVNRYASEDMDYGGLRIPKHMEVQAPVYLMHHDPEYWPDPETFDPERFSVKPNSDGITYLPFGIGPRNCMGMRFAQMEAKLALAHMLYNFRLEIGPSQKNKLPVTERIQTLAPTDGVLVKLLPREHETAL